MSFDPGICIHKIDAMQVIQDLTSHGYHWWATGEVEASKALTFSSKMDQIYGVGLDRNRRARRAAKGEANAQLVMYPLASSTSLRWLLLATDGTGEIHRREKLRRVDSKEHLEWRGYELVRLTFRSRSKASWTWRMTAAEVDAWKARFKRAASSENPVLMQQAVWSLYRTPGFAGIRQQVGHLMKYATVEWKTAGRKAPFPSPPPRLLYVRKRAKEQQPLSTLVRRVARGGCSWFGTAKRSVVIDGSG